MKKCFALSKTFGLTPFPLSAERLTSHGRSGAERGWSNERRRGAEAPRLLQDLAPPPA
jgi:hypothetical protein